MPFIPHTPEDLRAMLAEIDIPTIDALFGEIPDELRHQAPQLPPPLNESAALSLMRQRAGQDGRLVHFIGAGAYEHHIPAAVWELAGRGEFYTAYTPYQAEASQGTLQVIYEFQSMIAALLGLDAANASLYDGATALAEAVLMACRCAPKSGKILLPATLHPTYRDVLNTLVGRRGFELVTLPFCQETGAIPPESLARHQGSAIAALVIAQPNFFGLLEEVDPLTDWAHAQGALVVAQVNPLSCALLQPPGAWGQRGADIACGEGQPLGIPLASGGPYLGFLGCKQELLRQMPGRLVGRTHELERGDGAPRREGFVLTLQTREQHIRRARATSNICTNQGLMAIAATIYLSLMGPQGLWRTAAACHSRTRELVRHLTALPGVELVFPGRPYFHEVALRLPKPVAEVLPALAARGIAGGFPLGDLLSGDENSLLVCATEQRTPEQIADYGRFLGEILSC